MTGPIFCSESESVKALHDQSAIGNSDSLFHQNIRKMNLTRPALRTEYRAGRAVSHYEAQYMRTGSDTSHCLSQQKERLITVTEKVKIF
jgi:hypothetical protein